MEMGNRREEEVKLILQLLVHGSLFGVLKRVHRKVKSSHQIQRGAFTLLSLKS